MPVPRTPNARRERQCCPFAGGAEPPDQQPTKTDGVGTIPTNIGWPKAPLYWVTPTPTCKSQPQGCQLFFTCTEFTCSSLCKQHSPTCYCAFFFFLSGAMTHRARARLAPTGNGFTCQPNMVRRSAVVVGTLTAPRSSRCNIVLPRPRPTRSPVCNRAAEPPCIVVILAVLALLGLGEGDLCWG